MVNNGSGWKNDLGALVKRYLKTEVDKSNQKEDWSQRDLPKTCQRRVTRLCCQCWHRLSRRGSTNPRCGRQLYGAEQRAIADMQWQGWALIAKRPRSVSSN